MVKKILLSLVFIMLPLSLTYNGNNNANDYFVLYETIELKQDTIIKNSDNRNRRKNYVQNDSITSDKTKKDSITLNKRRGFVITLERRKITTLSVKKNK